jgi:hypothetical protein
VARVSLGMPFAPMSKSFLFLFSKKKTLPSREPPNILLQIATDDGSILA